MTFLFYGELYMRLYPSIFRVSSFQSFHLLFHHSPLSLCFYPFSFLSLSFSLSHTFTPPGLMDVSNPFKLTHIKNMLRSDFDTVGPCVVMAAPGFMQVRKQSFFLIDYCNSLLSYLFSFICFSSTYMLSY